MVRPNEDVAACGGVSKSGSAGSAGTEMVVAEEETRLLCEDDEADMISDRKQHSR